MTQPFPVVPQRPSVPPQSLPQAERDAIFAEHLNQVWNWMDQVARMCIPNGGVVEVDQLAHGFQVGDPVYFVNGTNWALAQADASATLAEAVVASATPDHFQARQVGEMTWLAHGLTVGTPYYLDPDTAGTFTTARTTTATEYNQRILKPLDADTVLLMALGGGDEFV